MNRTSRDREHLTEEEAALFHSGKCPDCGAGLREGPHGGASINVYCANDESCGSRFNEMGPFGIDRITDASPNKLRRETSRRARPTSWERLASPSEGLSTSDRRAIDAFHAHLDECSRCMNRPFDLCPKGGPLLAAAAGAPLPPSKSEASN